MTSGFAEVFKPARGLSARACGGNAGGVERERILQDEIKLPARIEEYSVTRARAVTRHQNRRDDCGDGHADADANRRADARMHFSRKITRECMHRDQSGSRGAATQVRTGPGM